MDLKDIMAVVDDAIKPAYLSKIQELVLKETWEGKTYIEIASGSGYDCEYIKSVGCELWQLLTQSFGQPVNKSNFQQFIRRWSRSISISQQTVCRERGSSINLSSSRVYRDWGTAPDTFTFQGRSKELEQLAQWSNEDQCKLIAIVGQVGIGKTVLATEFAERVQEQFDYLIWRSLRNAPPIEDMLDELICFLCNELVKEFPETLDAKILKLLQALRQSRCLLILDDMQTVLEGDSFTASYRSGYEGYSQFIHSIISTRHQSLLVITSWERPKESVLYEGNRVHSLVLDGLPELILEDIFKDQLPYLENKLEWTNLWKHYIYNPQLIKIALSSIQRTFESDFIQSLKQGEFAISEEICILLDQQFNRLSVLEKEIAYRLAFNHIPSSAEGLMTELKHPSSKVEVQEALINLTQRLWLDSNCNQSYKLKPLFREYLISRLIEKVYSVGCR